METAFFVDSRIAQTRIRTAKPANRCSALQCLVGVRKRHRRKMALLPKIMMLLYAGRNAWVISARSARSHNPRLRLAGEYIPPTVALGPYRPRQTRDRRDRA